MSSSKKKVLFKSPWFSIHEGEYKSFEGQTYLSLERQPGAICMVLNKNLDLVLVKQERPPLNRYTLEMPAGGIEKNEKPKEAAIREVLEETGFTCENLLYVTPLRVMINREDVVEHFFIVVLMLMKILKQK